MPGAFEMRVSARTEKFDPLDERWASQVDAFAQELHEVTRSAYRAAESTPASKGATQEIIVALSSAGVLTALIETLRSWLTRDRGRSIELSWFENGELRAVHITGAAMDDEPFGEILSALRDRLDDRC